MRNHVVKSPAIDRHEVWNIDTDTYDESSGVLIETFTNLRDAFTEADRLNAESIERGEVAAYLELIEDPGYQLEIMFSHPLGFELVQQL